MKKAEKGIRFIDSRYNQLFRIADGGRIKLEYPDGKSDIKICRFIDEYHVEVGITLFHICEFAERMEKSDVKYTPIIPALRDFCYSTLPSTGELIQIKFGTHGYSSCTVPSTLISNCFMPSSPFKNSSKADSIPFFPTISSWS